MRLRWIFLLFFCTFFTSIPSASSQLRLKFDGNLQSNLFIGLKPETTQAAGPLASGPPSSNLGKFFDYRNANSLFLSLNAKVSANLSGKAQVQIRNVNFSRATVSNDLEEYNQLFPVSVRLYEMYIDFLNLTEWFDLRVGQQRIAWGTGIGFNPTDNLNPFNLENPLDFKEKLPTPAIKASFYIPGNLTLTLVALPFFIPSILPISLFKNVATIDFPFERLVPAGLTLGPVTSAEKLEKLEIDVTNLQAAAKLAWEFRSINVSASYFYGRVNIPIPGQAFLTKFDLREGKVFPSTDVTLLYPRTHVVGFDITSSLGGIGLFAEVGITIPAESKRLQILHDLNKTGTPSDKNPLTQQPFCINEKNENICPEVFPAAPFPKVVAGLDYTFPGGFYVILQYLYGFFNEQAWDKLHHFGFLIMRQPLFRDRLLLQLTIGGEIDSTRTSGDKGDGSALGLAFLINPEIQWKPFDSGAITLGGIVARGNRGTTLSLFQDLDQIYLRFRMDF